MMLEPPFRSGAANAPVLARFTMRAGEGLFMSAYS